jgi:DNA-binding IclR family transcriptional regulator
MAKTGEKSPAPAADLAIRILILLSRYKFTQAKLSVIARELEESTSTCLRVLRTLRASDAVAFDEKSKTYSLGYLVAVLGTRAAETDAVLVKIQSILDEIAQNSGLTAAFVQRSGPDRLMYTAKSSPQGEYGVSVSVGNRFPVNQVSYGTWFARFGPEEHMLEQIPEPTVEEFSGEKGISYEELMELTSTSVVTNRGRYVRGIWTASIPALDVTGGIVGVVVALGIVESMSKERETDVIETMQAVATRLNTRNLEALR